MTKRDLIVALAERSGSSLQRAELMVNTIFDGMADALLDGERVEMRGFGSFELRSYDQYVGRNPKTGEAVFVAPKRLPFFKPGKELRERVNGGPYEAIEPLPPEKRQRLDRAPRRGRPHLYIVKG